MSSLFAGLEEFGLKNLDTYQVFEEEAMAPSTLKTIPKPQKRPLLYTRKVICPVCGSEVNTPTVKKSVAKLENIDELLRPVYSNIDPLCYDVCLCEVCGYAALGRHFKKINDHQIKTVREKISMYYTGEKYPNTFDYEIALRRYKLALLNDVLITRPEIERSLTCLKATWVLKALIESTEDSAKKETFRLVFKEFAATAYEGFKRSYDFLSFPVYGMSIDAYHYLLGTLAFHSGNIDEAGQWLNRTLISFSSSERIKGKARDLKEELKKLKEKAV